MNVKWYPPFHTGEVQVWCDDDDHVRPVGGSLVEAITEAMDRLGDDLGLYVLTPRQRTILDLLRAGF